MDKYEIRRKIKASKELLTQAEKMRAAAKVFERLERLAAYAVSERILMYHSLPDELSTHSFIDRWNGRKQFFLPRVNGVNLEVLPYDRTAMRSGAFHIEEPQGDDITDPSTMDLIIVPAVAFDRMGNRVGRGKGYYDRMLSGNKSLKIGVAYDFQLVDQIDGILEEDVPVDIVITESHTIVIHRGRN